MSVRIRLLISLVVLGFGSVASAGELVSNGGFETGDFTDWTNSNFGAVVGTRQGISPYEGSYQARFISANTLTQTLATTVNGSETISFALAYHGDDTVSYEVYFGGNLLATISNIGKSYQTYSYQTTATSASTDLSFVQAEWNSYFYLDAVSVTETAAAVPEPSTLALACVACVSGLGHAVFRRRKAKLAA